MGLSDSKSTSEVVEIEACRVTQLATRSTAEFLRTLQMVSDTFLAQVLNALWDSGLYEYVRNHTTVIVKDTAAELGLEETVLESLIEYLEGRGLMRWREDGFVLTDRGETYWNYVTRGVLTCYVGGYNPVLSQLGPLLKKQVDLNDPRLDRLGRLVAVGSNYSLLGNGTAPWVLEVIKELGGKCVLDLGCGSGQFLNQLALRWPDGSGVGVDMDLDAIGEATRTAVEFGVADRLNFCHAKLSAEPMELSAEVKRSVDIVTAMYLLHEFRGRGGVENIALVLASLRRQFPGRKLLMVEGTRADAAAMGTAPRRSYGQLDYSFFHPLSRQGSLLTPDEWQQVIESAGAKLIDRIVGQQLIPSWISLYVIDLE
jgi:SAM-dependent methyltransferase